MSLELYNTTRKEIPQKKLEVIIENVIESEGYALGSVIAVYCGDRMIHRINREFLGHDYPTDTVTFKYNTMIGEIEGEFYISLDVVAKNAKCFGTGFENELFRVTIHSALHLTGYEDSDEDSRAAMKEKEDYYLDRLSFQ
ncbi:rRNA maturation RNase YbeY [Prosthecochloris sp.]|jgi:rRNA maturation RNase YbeY|uniref:rRNA maturation RNase YbeY n=1 Tax=Prosthecochloris sp. TaxID=290513 RepID=UPI0025DD8B9D|nr:rRNA maturation RNase YbeY [Prosthecochloris sp.]